MDPYFYDWLHLLIRLLHVVTAIAWIGASFYFVWLDNSLETPPQWKKDKGIKGDLWSIHGGGFYEIAKYQLGPEKMPARLHWFKWEAYSTWITGMFLLILIYYVGASSYMIDPAKADLNQWQAIGLGLATLLVGFLAYEGLCRTPLIDRPVLLGLVLLGLLTFLAWLLSQYIGNRAAYIHIGALIGTCMAANVFTTIMPSQRALVRAVEQGQSPDPKYGLNAKRRSTHNNYATLPVLFIMLSNHSPMTYSHEYGWAILGALMLIGAWARHFFNLRHQGIVKPSILISALIAFLLLIVLARPQPLPTFDASEQPVSDQQAFSIVMERCATCHSRQPSDDIFRVSPGGVYLETASDIQRQIDRIEARTLLTHDMPFMNKTQMTLEERALLGQWIQQQRQR
ncbi:MAG: urate hydroxylase PuuD [Nitrincola lacisaponensis]|uniref:urate hydroxylase PuuD n=1 Tax=Nitrincola lacisaponensis TaxID=267850 RepID=UPI003918E086